MRVASVIAQNGSVDGRKEFSAPLAIPGHGKAVRRRAVFSCIANAGVNVLSCRRAVRNGTPVILPMSDRRR
jgi:hypothetical protein